MPKIQSLHAREILDSRGNPTVECVLSIGNGSSVSCVPSGASTGAHEAVELRDGGKRYLGLGVRKAVANVNTMLNRALKGLDTRDLDAIDAKMIKLDGTSDKSRLGANAILAVSMACARASGNGMLYENILKLSGNRKAMLPMPFCNVVNGGKHAGNGLDFQEYMIVPTGAKSFSEATQMVSETYHVLKRILLKKYGKNAVNVGDEGGFAPPLTRYEEPLLLLELARDESGYGKKIKFAMDCASSSFWSKGGYVFEGRRVDTGRMVDVYSDLLSEYDIVSIEDPFHEEDFDSFASFVKHHGKSVQIVGDDLLTTNPSRIDHAVSLKSCNALLLKVNQIGTVTESIRAWNLARLAGWNTMVSHRSGETADTFISHLSVGLGCGQIKIGAPCRSERVEKYNELLRLEEERGLRLAKF